MKQLLSILFVLSFVTYFSQTKKVSVKIKQFMPYCGGVAPTAEMEANLKVPVPYANKKLICVSSKNKIDTITTDANGFIKMKLSNGKYHFFEPWKYFKQLPNGESSNNIKMDCLATEWAKPDIIITVGKKITTINNIEYVRCPYQFPCLIQKHLPQ